jgi:hypothetical protein
MRKHASQKALFKVEIQNPDGTVIWSFRDGVIATGHTSMSYLTDGTQESVIDALLVALAEARGQLRRPLQVLNVVPYVRPATGQVDDNIPVS